MTVVSTTKDTQALSLVIVAELAAPPEKVWQIWADPRKLERWWGPPEWPATFPDHDFRVGGHVSYFMTGPDGEKAHGWWTFLSIDEHRSIEFEDGFADDAGQPSDEMPTIHGRVTFEPLEGGTRMTVTSRFDTLEDLEKLVAMGMADGMTAAMGQIDAVLPDA